MQHATATHDATLFRQLRGARIPIPTNDLWIAALLIQHDITLFTGDVHFDAIPQLAGLALAAGAYFSFLWAGTFGVLLALAFLAHSGNAVFHPFGTAIVAERFPYRRAIAISVFGIAGNIGATATPLVQGIIANSAGWHLSVGAFAVPMALLLPVIRLRFPPLPRDRQGLSRLSRRPAPTSRTG